MCLQIHRRLRRRPGFALAAATAVLITPVLASPAWAGGGGYTSPTVVASGLKNPRLLSIDNGRVYVAEAGSGGSGACVAGAEGGEVCLGYTGAITQISAYGQRRVVDQLPSLAGADGTQAIGPADVQVSGSSYQVTLGLGMNPAERGFDNGAKRLGTLIKGNWRSHTSSVAADLAAFELANNPDGSANEDGTPAPDSNPVGLFAAGRTTYVADAGGNDILKVRKGKISVVATLPSVLADAPPFLGLPAGTQIPAQAVPTSVIKGGDGALYVSQLIGFPFPAGKASIYRIGRDGVPTVYASGLTNVTDLAWYRGSLYAVQLADDGLLATPEGERPSGSLVKIVHGSSTTVLDDLDSPYGVAFKGGYAYVTTCSVCATEGTVVRARVGR